MLPIFKKAVFVSVFGFRSKGVINKKTPNYSFRVLKFSCKKQLLNSVS